LKLENDKIRAMTEDLEAGLDKEDIKTKRTISGKYLFNLSTWYVYKHIVNWMIADETASWPMSKAAYKERMPGSLQHQWRLQQESNLR